MGGVGLAGPRGLLPVRCKVANSSTMARTVMPNAFTQGGVPGPGSMSRGGGVCDIGVSPIIICDLLRIDYGVWRVNVNKQRARSVWEQCERIVHEPGSSPLPT